MTLPQSKIGSEEPILDSPLTEGAKVKVLSETIIYHRSTGRAGPEDVLVFARVKTRIVSGHRPLNDNLSKRCTGLPPSLREVAAEG